MRREGVERVLVGTAAWVSIAVVDRCALCRFHIWQALYFESVEAHALPPLWYRDLWDALSYLELRNLKLVVKNEVSKLQGIPKIACVGGIVP